MENWRKSIVEVLRECNGESNLEEIYEKIKPSIPNLDIAWKAGTRSTLEINSSDSEAWNRKHDLFGNIEKGSGVWKLRTNYYRNEILDPHTNFYFLTTGKKKHGDINYEKYTWNVHQNNKLKTGDIFIYRVSQKNSFNNQFYFFGAGKIGTIYAANAESKPDFKEGDVFANIIKPIEFENSIFQGELKPSDLDHEGKNWERYFQNYGIDEISLDKFLFILNKGTNKDIKFDPEENEIQIETRKKIFEHDYKVPNSRVTAKSRGIYQRIFREKIILPNYEYRCAITGIKTKSCLTAAHILKWADYEEYRLDPQNGICLSKLVDICFERNLIYIDDTYRVNLRDKVKQDKKLYKELIKYEGKKIHLPTQKILHPNKKFLEIHRNKIK